LFFWQNDNNQRMNPPWTAGSFLVHSKNPSNPLTILKNPDYLSVIKVNHKVTLSFTLYPIFEWYPQKKWKFIKSQYEMLTRLLGVVVVRCSSCTGRSSENICSSSGGAQEKGKRGRNSVYHQNWWKTSLGPSDFVL